MMSLPERASVPIYDAETPYRYALEHYDGRQSCWPSEIAVSTGTHYLVDRPPAAPSYPYTSIIRRRWKVEECVWYSNDETSKSETSKAINKYHLRLESYGITQGLFRCYKSEFDLKPIWIFVPQTKRLETRRIQAFEARRIQALEARRIQAGQAVIPASALPLKPDQVCRPFINPNGQLLRWVGGQWRPLPSSNMDQATPKPKPTNEVMAPAHLAGRRSQV